MAGTKTLARYGVWLGALLVVCVALAVIFGQPRTPEPSQPQEPSRSSRDTLTTTLDELASSLDTLQREVAREGDAADAKGQLRRLRQTLEQAERLGAEDFAAIDAHLRQHGLPQAILDRHTQAVDTYTSEMAALKASLDAVLDAPEDGLLLAQLTKTRERLSSYQGTPRWRRFDPSHLPMQALKPRLDHVPKLTVQEFRLANLTSQSELQPESMVLQTSGALPGADDPAFLAPTTEIVLTPAIQARANALDRNPVKIFAWASDQLEWNPGWGALQSAEHTLGSGRGNAIDLASALIALLRASGIPARYVHGTVEMDAERFKLLVGNFESAGAAIDYASASGLPIAAVTSGGRIARVRFEHVWVEAAVDFHPSRGAVNRVPDHWVGLDAAVKRADSFATPDYLALSGVNAEAALQAFAASGTADAEAGWVQGLDVGALESALTPTAEASAQVKTALRAFLQGTYHASDTTSVAQIAGGLRVTPRTDSMLPASLPYGVLVVGARYAQLPPMLQARATISLGLDEESADSVTLPLVRVNNENLTVSFTFASAADHDTFVSFLPTGPITDLSQLPSSIPAAYLISVVPQIRLGEQVILSAPAVRLGQSVRFGVALNLPGVVGANKPLSQVVAGSQLSLVIFAGSANRAIFDKLRTRYGEAAALLATGSVDDLLGYAANFTSRLSSDGFHAAALEYFARQVTMADFMTTGARLGRIHLVSGAASFGYVPTPRFWFGIPRTLALGTLVFDAPNLLVNAQSSTGDAEHNRLLMQRFGMLGSGLEGDVPAYFWSRDLSTPRTGVSAASHLRTALKSGQRIYSFTSRNRGSIAQLRLSADARADITAAVDAGYEVITHQSPIAVGGSVAGVNSAGYVVLDPVSGAGQYLLDNGTNGGLTNFGDELMANCAYMNRPGWVDNEVDWKRFQITRKCANAVKEINEELAETNASLMQAKINAVIAFHEVYAKIPMVIADCITVGAPLALSEALVLVRTGAAMMAVQAADMRSLAIAEHMEDVADALKEFVDAIHEVCMAAPG